MAKNYEERMKEHGYTEEMLQMEKAMSKAAQRGLKVKIVCTDGTAYIGNAFGYTSADDEETEFSSVCVKTESGNFGFFVHQLKSFEEITQ